MNHVSHIKIFMASGKELINERKETIQVVHELRKVFPSLDLEVVQWETDLPSGSYDKKRIQDEINSRLEQCSIVLVLFYSKIGTFTLEEFRFAMAENKKVFLYFKTGFSAKNKAENDNYGSVLALHDEIESGNRIIIKNYKMLKNYRTTLKDDLNLYLSQRYASTIVVEKEILSVLNGGSKKYYEALRGPNGRFKFLRISDIILPGSGGNWLETCAEIDNIKFYGGSGGGFSKEAPGNNRTILDVLPRLWAREIKHAVIVGDGGMGKTVSLIQWWQKLLENSDKIKPVPVYIALNEFNQVPEGKRENFILSYILKNYGDDDTTLEQIEKIITPQLVTDHSPTMVLLLDGFNEITVEKRELLLELNRLAEQCPSIQIVMTSRYDIRGNFNWGHWTLIRLMPLEDGQVDRYLGKETPIHERLRQLVKNPMMLTLYAATCEVQKSRKGSSLYHFKDRVETPGELLWNFMEAQVAKLPERLGQDEERIFYYKFLLKFLLPALGFEMEKSGLFDFTIDQVNSHLDNICKRFSRDDFFDTFYEFEKYIDMLPLGECSDAKERRKRVAALKKIVCQELSMLAEEGNSFRFLHQNFRDFFSAVHVLNETDMSLKKGEIPGVLTERILEYFVRRMLGEIEGEHYCKPYLVKEKGWEININKKNRFYRALELCRGKFSNKIPLSEVFGSTEPFSQKEFYPPEAEVGMGYAVWNIVTIWKEVRDELSGADLSRLDLSGIALNGFFCSRFYKNRYLAASFAGSRIHEKNLLPQGHSSYVNSAVYSPDGEKILSASYDHSIKEWDARTGECVKTLTGHSDIVTKAQYSPDGEKILSASSDKTIKEWDAGTGECVKTLAGHNNWISSAVYSPDGEKILSASYDHSIKEWDARTGECVKTLTGHSSYVSSAMYSPDGKKILSASYDKTIKEWDTGTGVCVKTLIGHTEEVTGAVYSLDGEKILSASSDNTIKEWDAGTGQCVKTMSGHLDMVSSAFYSLDGKKILSASLDQTIKVWDAGTGQCVKTLAGFSEWINSAVYSPNGEKILSASNDRTIKEWDAGTGECVKNLAGNSDIVTRAEYSPDGGKILTASSDNTIKEWDAGTGECMKILAGHTNWVISAVYSPDGKKILSATWNYSIKEWDTGTGECVKNLAGGHSSYVTCAVYSPNGKKIISACRDDTINEWDAVTGACLNTYNKNDNPKIPGYPPNDANIRLRIDGNKVYAPDASGNGKTREFINIPGLFIQGCSFQNLEKGSQWSTKGLAILKQYHAIL